MERAFQRLDDHRLTQTDVLHTNLLNAALKAAFAADEAGTKPSLLKAEHEVQTASGTVAKNAKRTPAKPSKGA